MPSALPRRMTRTLASGSWCDPATFPASATPTSRRAHRHARARLRRRLLSELAELDHFSHAASFWPSGNTSVCGTSPPHSPYFAGLLLTRSVERCRGRRAGTFPNPPQAPATATRRISQRGESVDSANIGTGSPATWIPRFWLGLEARPELSQDKPANRLRQSDDSYAPRNQRAFLRALLLVLSHRKL